MTNRSKISLSIAGSVLLNLLGLYANGVYLGWQEVPAPEPEPESVPDEVVLLLDELIPEDLQPDAEEPAAPRYVETFANQESDMEPENAAFESDRNTLAATTRLSMTNADPLLPSVEGEDFADEIISLQDHNFMDGEDKPIPRSSAAMASPPTPPAEQAQPRPESANPSLSPMAQPTTAMSLRPDTFDISKQNFLYEPEDFQKPDEKESDQRPDEVGGQKETFEMAKADIPQRREAFSDMLDQLDESDPLKEGDLDSMPERNPEVENAIRPDAASPNPESAAPPPVPTPLAKPTEAPQPRPPSQPSPELMGAADQAAFSPARRIQEMEGGVDRIGSTAAVSARRTALGAYKKSAARAIERRWHQLRVEYAEYVIPGNIRLSFRIDSSGTVSGLRITHDDANSFMKEFTLKAIMSADIPPMPPEVRELTRGQSIHMDYRIVIN